MVLVHNYSTAVFFFMTMICWGSWANTQKLAAKSCRFELYYWDLSPGLLLAAIIAAVSLGTPGNNERSFF